MSSYDPQDDDVLILDGLPRSTLTGTDYQIKITLGEVRAMAWIGNRYRHGDELLKILDVAFGHNLDEWMQIYALREVPVIVPEHEAWKIKEIVDEDPNLSCMGDGFALKLHEFCSKIV